jgi:UDPglucose 6-dehydrogenase
MKEARMNEAWFEGAGPEADAARDAQALVDSLVARFGGHLCGLRFALWGGLDAPLAREMSDALLARGAAVHAFDPDAPAGVAVRGRARLTCADDAMRALDDASALLVLGRQRAFQAPDFSSVRARLRHPLLIDGCSRYAAKALREAGIERLAAARPKQRHVTLVAPACGPQPLAA